VNRSDYTDDDGDNWSLIRYRGAVTSAIRGRRGQAFLRELRDALDAMPEKVLIADELINEDGDFCALGVVGARRGIDLKVLDPEDYYELAKVFGISKSLVREIEFENDDDWCHGCTPEKRWTYMRRWVERQIINGQENESASKPDAS
jgi:hypothetical protein